jgi:hypothetical protein
VLPDGFAQCAGSAPAPEVSFAPDLNHAAMSITLRVTRHDRNEQLLAECLSDVIPARGEVLQLDTVESDGTTSRLSTMWRIVAVTIHVPSLQSAAPASGEPLSVKTVEVSVLPDVSLLPALHHAAEEILAESRM